MTMNNICHLEATNSVIQVLSYLMTERKVLSVKIFPMSKITTHECGIKYRNSMAIIVIAGFLLAAVHCVHFK